MIYIKCRGDVLECLIDTRDLERVLNYGTWYGNVGGGGVYAYCKRNYKIVAMHRVILRVANRHRIVDHKNMNTLDNRRCNIHVVTHGDNVSNKYNPHMKARSSSTSGFRHVHWDNRENKWRVYMQYNKKAYSLGMYSELIDAVMVAAANRNRLFGLYTGVRTPILP